MQQHLPTHPGHGPAGLSPGMINPHNAMAAGLSNPSGLLALTNPLGAGHGIPGMPGLPPNPAGLPGLPPNPATTPGSVGTFKNHRTEEGIKRSSSGKLLFSIYYVQLILFNE